MSGKDRPRSVLDAMAHRHYQQWETGTAATEYALGVTVLRLEDVWVFVDGALMRPSDRGTAHDYAVRGLTPGYEGDSNRVKFSVAPNGLDVCFLVVGG